MVNEASKIAIICIPEGFILLCFCLWGENEKQRLLIIKYFPGTRANRIAAKGKVYSDENSIRLQVYRKQKVFPELSRKPNFLLFFTSDKCFFRTAKYQLLAKFKLIF